ncbi:MAG TPA: thrombospondin type 3 repeat-containing protein, partial [Candidatus Acidoferrum sp.]|nr:thrombospondin type 3 repeat-containing protein [Candidatus Acidoferrum sp.]
VIVDEALSQPMTSPNRFEISAGQGGRLGVMSRLAGSGFDTFQILDLSSGAFLTRLSFIVPLTNAPRAEFIAHRFDTNNSLGQVLFFRPGDAGLLKYQVQLVGLNFQFISSNAFTLGAGLQSLRALPLTGGARLLAFFGPTATNLTNATIFTFDGVTPPQVVQTFTGSFSGALAIGGGNVVLLNADAAGRSSTFQVLLASGAGYTFGTGGVLPAVNRFSGSANALLFDAEPFVNAAARPRQFQRHADWSTALRVAPTLRVTSQRFLSESNGLGSASTRDFGTAMSGVTTGLVNQYTSTISVFSGRPAVGASEGDVRISPPGGHYGEAQNITLSFAPLGWAIRYRVSENQNWLNYTTPFLLLSNATIEFHARRISDGILTPFGRAGYTFSDSIQQLDSDNDGVPDFVEQTRGLNPFDGADSDRDGFTDLEELARGTNPLSAASKPAGNASLRTAVNRLVSPRSPHPNTGTGTRAHTNVAIRAFTAGGSFLGQEVTRSEFGTGITNPAALLVNLLPEAGTRLIAETSPDHFDINAAPDSRVGRELIGLFPVPNGNEFSVSYTFGGGSLATETANWIVAASNAVAAAVNPTVPGLLTPESSLVAALFERLFANALLARGTNWATNATLFPFRASDADRRFLDSAALLTVEQYGGSVAPAYRQRVAFESLDQRVRSSASVAVLVALTRELWRISAAHHNTNEGVFPLPFDEMRRVISGEPPTPAYVSFSGIATNLATARTQASNVLSAVPQRPRTNLTVIVADSFGGQLPILRHSQTSTRVILWRFDGEPCSFPPNLQLLPGAQIGVIGFADVTATPGTLAVEVISLTLDGVPMPSPGDADGNLLADSWEGLFFGDLGNDAFADSDGDSYSNLQEMFAGTAPDDSLIIPGGQPFSIVRPLVQLVPNGNQWRLIFQWPDALMNQLQFGFQESGAVTGPYQNSSTPIQTISLGGNTHELRFENGADPYKFYRLTFRLN